MDIISILVASKLFLSRVISTWWAFYFERSNIVVFLEQPIDLENLYGIEAKNDIILFNNLKTNIACVVLEIDEIHDFEPLYRTNCLWANNQKPAVRNPQYYIDG